MGLAIPNPYDEDQVLVTHYVKEYPDRKVVIKFKSPYPEGTNPYGERRNTGWLQTEEEKLDCQEDALARAKTRISDLIICNEFNLFVTFTLNCRACKPKCYNKPCTCDKTRCMRYNLEYAIRTQKAWYNNQIKKYGRFPYLQVMELHKDRGIHFHALFKDYPGPLQYAKRDKDGRSIYNLTSYKKGWTTAKKIYDISGAASYVKKYITKDMPLFPGKKRYWVSQGLLRPIVTQEPEVAEEILNDPDAKAYIPSSEPTLRTNGTLRPNSKNIESITTLLLDNRQSYFSHLEALERLKAIGKILGVAV